MAAVAGVVDFGPLTLKELVWRWDSVRRERWEHTAMLAFCVARGPLQGRLKLADFNPMSEASKPPPPKPENLPETLTAAEIMERWAKVKEKVRG